ncbi:hypothetical protein ACI68E_001594 [Malassezia pachydermatis]
MRWLWFTLGLCAVPAFATQRAFQYGVHEFHNLVDLLPSHPELSTFTHLLQRTRLIPSLNRMQEMDLDGQGMTIFAPSNQAFEEASKSMEWLEFLTNSSTLPDNIHAKLRQHLWYHILNYTLPEEGPSKEFVETMHLPSRKRLFEPTRPGTVPQNPPNPGAEDDGQLLRGHGQLVRIERSKSGSLTKIGINHDGSQDDFLTKQNISTLFRHFPDELLASLSTTPHLTMFLPTDRAWNKLSELERNYLLSASPQAEDDRMRVFGWHVSSQGLGHGYVAYASDLRKAGSVPMTSILGGVVNVTLKKNQSLYYGHARVIYEDILTENGVVHIIDGMHLPFGDLGMSVEKYLLGLQADRFVSLMHSAGLELYITQDPHEPPPPGAPKGPFTFLIPPSEELDKWYLSSTFLPSSSSSDMDIQEIREILKYHILPGNYSKDAVASSMVATELHPPGLSGAPQRLGITVKNSNITFGTVPSLRGPIPAGNSTVYLLGDVIRVPNDPVYTAAYHAFPTFVRALSKANLEKETRHAPLRTHLAPSEAAFTATGLVAKYLFNTHSDDLANVLSYHSIPGLWYSDTIPKNWTSLKTDEGSFLSLCRDNSGIHIKSDSVNITHHLTNIDTLTDTGVLHGTSHLHLPASVPITMNKLAQGTSAKQMITLLNRTGFDWVWNDTLTLDGFGNCGKQRLILLLPEDSAFAKINMTWYEQNPNQLKALVALHILLVDDCKPLPHMSLDLPLALTDEMEHISMLDKRSGGSSRYGSLAVRKTAVSEKNPLGLIIGIKGARARLGMQHAAQIVDFGRTNRPTTHSQVLSGGILSLDTVLEPYESDWLQRSVLYWQLGLVAVLLFLGMGIYYLRQWRAAYTRVLAEPLEGEEE